LEPGQATPVRIEANPSGTLPGDRRHRPTSTLPPPRHPGLFYTD
jgi:hypothetical protein